MNQQLARIKPPAWSRLHLDQPREVVATGADPAALEPDSLEEHRKDKACTGTQEPLALPCHLVHEAFLMDDVAYRPG